MLEKIRNYVEANKMLEYKDKVIMGLSGGADSVCLFFVLLALREEYNLELCAVHVNHGIRGLPAKEDEDFVGELCLKFGVDLTVIQEDVIKISKTEGLTEEEAGRRVRYNAFYQVMKEKNGNKIAVAHHMNDSAETILFHLFRGSGMKGLSGIRAVRDEIIRPLLSVTRQEIEEYLRIRQISYQTDQSNFVDAYSRNKIRLNVIPYVTEEINLKTVQHIVWSGKLIGEAEEYIQKTATNAYKRIVQEENGQYSFVVAIIQNEEIIIQKYIIRIILNKLAGKLKDLEYEHINMVLQLMEKPVGKHIDLPYHITAVKKYDSVVMKKKSQIKKELTTYEQRIEIPNTYYISLIDRYMELSLVKFKKNKIIPVNGYTKWFDYDKIKNTVFIRTRRTGDYLQIDKKGGTKKLKALYIDNKTPKEERDKIPLLADGSHIMWVLGDRISEAYKVDENTKNILVVKVYGGKEDE